MPSGLAFIGHGSGPRTAKDDLKVALAGPLSHVPQAALWLLFLRLPLGSWAGNWLPATFTGLSPGICVGAVDMNLHLLLVNLFVPCYPLDGGRIVVALMLMVGVGVTAAAKVCLGLSAPLAVAICIHGYMQEAPLCVFVGLWIAGQVKQLWDVLRAGTVHTHPMFQVAPAALPGSGERDVALTPGV